MTYIAKPIFNPPGFPRTPLGTPIGTTKVQSPPCAPAVATIRSAPPLSKRALSWTSRRTGWLSSPASAAFQNPDLFSRQFAWIQFCPRPHARGADRRNLANRELIYLGVSGDGDSASIGLGQFAHAIRRGVDMVYIVENNGVYGLTKGQFSATADRGSKSKRGLINNDGSIDLAALALQMGASFVARSFSGDKAQLVPLIKAALEHRGAAFIDCISPCVAFNNHPGSTKSFDYVREHNEAVNRLDFMTPRAPIHVDYLPGSVEIVEQHDGSKLMLRKLAADYDPHNRLRAMSYLQERAAEGEIVTGLLFVDPEPQELHAHLDTIDTPLNTLGEGELCQGAEVLAQINAGLR